MVSINEGIEREKQEVAGMFTENLDLKFYDMSRTYCTFKVESVNGVKPTGTLLVSFYDDYAYISDREMREGYAGKLTVFDKVSQYNALSFERRFRTADCANPRYEKLPAIGEKMSFVEMLCRAQMRSGRDMREDRGVLLAAKALGVIGEFGAESAPESIEAFRAWFDMKTTHKLTDEKLVAELMKDYGWSREETINGYGVFEVIVARDYEITGAWMVVCIDSLYGDYRFDYGITDDWDACRQAEKDGVKFINDMDGLEKGRYVDTPENRRICAAYLAEHPEARIENWFSECSADFQADYVERYGDPMMAKEQAQAVSVSAHKLTDEGLIVELMKDYGWSREDTINGYARFDSVCPNMCDVDGAVEICRIDDLYCDDRFDYGFDNDFDACRQAEKDGVKFINDMDGLEKGRYVDTPENRRICAAYLAEHPEARIENWFTEVSSDYQKAYVEAFGSPTIGSIDALRRWIGYGGLETDIDRYDVPKNEQHSQRWSALFDYVTENQLDNVKPFITDIVEKYEAGKDVGEFLDGLEKGMGVMGMAGNARDCAGDQTVGRENQKVEAER